MAIRRVGVVGAGTMGSGIAQVAALAGTKLIEVAPDLGADPTTGQAALGLWKRLGKEEVLVRDGAGMVLFRTLCTIINEAAFALAEGLVSAKEIDTAMTLGLNYLYGPLEWADKVAEMGEDRYRPAPLLRQMVLAGHRGEGAGRGFYTYR